MSSDFNIEVVLKKLNTLVVYVTILQAKISRPEHHFTRLKVESWVIKLCVP